jgi:hypothetical protein
MVSAGSELSRTILDYQLSAMVQGNTLYRNQIYSLVAAEPLFKVGFGSRPV